MRAAILAALFELRQACEADLSSEDSAELLRMILECIRFCNLEKS